MNAEVREVPKELTESIRAEFKRLLEGDDFIQNLTTIEKLAARSRELILTISVPPGMLRGGGGNPMMSSPTVYPTVYQDNIGAMVLGSNVSGTVSSPEQFGARAIRQLVELAPEIAETIGKAINGGPAGLVKAICVAKVNGMEALAAKLEAKLLGEDAPEESEHEHTNGAIVAQPEAP
jgi:hypothetical protein